MKLTKLWLDFSQRSIKITGLMKTIFLHPLFYVALSTFSFAISTLSFTPTGFFVVVGGGFLVTSVWRGIVLGNQLDRDNNW